MKKINLLIKSAAVAVFYTMSAAKANAVTTMMMAGPPPGGGIADVAGNISDNLSGVALLITGGAYVAGLGFSVGAILKFKAHKDNPTQIPVGTPIALTFIAAALLFIPSIIKTTGGTLYGAKGGISTGTEGFSDISHVSN